MAAQKANINHRMLAWARDEAGLSLPDAARLAKVQQSRKHTAEERLEQWENGEDFPTKNQLQQLAKAYYRPILTFYMRTPPSPNSDVADFRTIADEDVNQASPLLRALVSKMKARQQEVLDILIEEDEEPEPLPFVGRFSENWNVEAIAKDIEEELGLSQELRAGLTGSAALLILIRNSAEKAGVYVLAQGDLGSHHSDIPPNVFRGFALADPIAPFVVLNDNDAKAAQVFTLLHELAHIWIGDTGISNFNPFDRNQGNDEERLCNSVAAEFLMPQATILRSWEAYKEQELVAAIEELANSFGVSRAALALRLWKLNQIEERQWWALYEDYKKEWDDIKAKQRSSGGSPPLYFPIKKFQLGTKLIHTILGAVESGEITYTRAARILDAAPENFERLRS